MPRHPYPPADHDSPIDIKFRNGEVRRSTLARKWRWKPWDWGESDWDIVDWKQSK